MNLFTSLDISASGLTAQRFRLNLISSNMANVNTTQTPEGGPYRRQDATLAQDPVKPQSFEEALRSVGLNPVNKVRVLSTFTDPKPAQLVYEPGHPDADDSGLVAMPNINIIEEMANLLTTMRAYEANLTVIGSTKEMIKNTLKI